MNLFELLYCLISAFCIIILTVWVSIDLVKGIKENIKLNKEKKLKSDKGEDL